MGLFKLKLVRVYVDEVQFPKIIVAELLRISKTRYVL